MSDELEAPGIADLDERININLEKQNLTLEDIKKDTNDLIKHFEWTVARCMVQTRIYKDLLERIEERIKERDKNG